MNHLFGYRNVKSAIDLVKSSSSCVHVQCARYAYVICKCSKWGGKIPTVKNWFGYNMVFFIKQITILTNDFVWQKRKSREVRWKCYLISNFFFGYLRIFRWKYTHTFELHWCRFSLSLLFSSFDELWKRTKRHQYTNVLLVLIFLLHVWACVGMYFNNKLINASTKIDPDDGGPRVYGFI